MASQRFSTKLSTYSRRLAQRSACYFNGQQHYQLNGEAYTGDKPWLLILAKACYQEQVESYPVKSVRELKQLLELQRPSDVLTRYFIGPFKNNQRLVSKVIIDAAYLTAVQNTRVVLPETLILAEFAPAGLTAIEQAPNAQNSTQASTHTNKMWFYRGPQLCAAVTAGGMVRDEQAARVTLGVSSQAPAQSWAFHDYLASLSENWWRLPLSWWSVARNASVQRTGLPWLPMSAVAVAMVVLYGVISSSYLHFATQARSDQMASLSSDVSQRLAQRDQLDNDIAKLSALEQAASLSPSQAYAWNIIAYLKQNEIYYSQMSGDSQAIELSGEAESATDLVAQLQQLPGVQGIEFIAPVRRGRLGEVYSLRIALAEQDNG